VRESAVKKRFCENTQGKENAHTHTYLGVYILYNIYIYIYIPYTYPTYVCASVYTSHGGSVVVETASGVGIPWNGAEGWRVVTARG